MLQTKFPLKTTTSDPVGMLRQLMELSKRPPEPAARIALSQRSIMNQTEQMDTVAKHYEKKLNAIFSATSFSERTEIMRVFRRDASDFIDTIKILDQYPLIFDTVPGVLVRLGMQLGAERSIRAQLQQLGGPPKDRILDLCLGCNGALSPICFGILSALGSDKVSDYFESDSSKVTNTINSLQHRVSELTAVLSELRDGKAVAGNIRETDPSRIIFLVNLWRIERLQESMQGLNNSEVRNILGFATDNLRSRLGLRPEFQFNQAYQSDTVVNSELLARGFNPELLRFFSTPSVQPDRII